VSIDVTFSSMERSTTPAIVFADVVDVSLATPRFLGHTKSPPTTAVGVVSLERGAEAVRRIRAAIALARRPTARYVSVLWACLSISPRCWREPISFSKSQDEIDFATLGHRFLVHSIACQLKEDRG